MKQQINEIKRMQQLAGLLKENEEYTSPSYELINEQKLNEDAGWSKILFGKTIKEIWKDIYSEINPVLKYKKMKKYRQQLVDDVEQLKREIEEKKRAIQELEKLKEKNYLILKNPN